MAAEIPKFNESGANGKAPLVPQNSQMSPYLAASGNAVSVLVEAITPKSSSWTSPGANWTARRVTGLGPRRVVWDWMCVAVDQAGLNAVEAIIEGYLAGSREYVLDDGKGRASNYGVLLGSQGGTGRVGRRLTLGSRQAQRWRLVFMVLYPEVASDKL